MLLSISLSSLCINIEITSLMKTKFLKRVFIPDLYRFVVLHRYHNLYYPSTGKGRDFTKSCLTNLKTSLIIVLYFEALLKNENIIPKQSLLYIQGLDVWLIYYIYNIILLNSQLYFDLYKRTFFLRVKFYFEN